MIKLIEKSRELRSAVLCCGVSMQYLGGYQCDRWVVINVTGGWLSM